MKSFKELKVGDKIPEYPITIEKEKYFAYNELVNEINPLHFDEVYARSIGFRDPIVAGVYTFSFIPGIIEKWIEKPGVCRKIELRFIKPIYINDKILLKGTIVNKHEDEWANFIDCKVLVINEEGLTVIEASVQVEFSPRALPT